MIHLYVEKEPEAPSTFAPATTVATTAAAVTGTVVTLADTTAVVTTAAAAAVTVTSVTAAVYDGPYITFRLDFTSYFIGSSLYYLNLSIYLIAIVQSIGLQDKSRPFQNMFHS